MSKVEDLLEQQRVIVQTLQSARDYADLTRAADEAAQALVENASANHVQSRERLIAALINECGILRSELAATERKLQEIERPMPYLYRSLASGKFYTARMNVPVEERVAGVEVLTLHSTIHDY